MLKKRRTAFAQNALESAYSVTYNLRPCCVIPAVHLLRQASLDGQRQDVLPQPLHALSRDATHCHVHGTSAHAR
ncbi:protein of unknown function [Paraburkholderia kururiensis]